MKENKTKDPENKYVLKKTKPKTRKEQSKLNLAS